MPQCGSKTLKGTRCSRQCGQADRCFQHTDSSAARRRPGQPRSNEQCSQLHRLQGKFLGDGKNGQAQLIRFRGEDRAVKFSEKNYSFEEITTLRAAGRNNPYVVRFIESCENKEDAIIVMENLSGGELFDVKSDYITEAFTERVALQLLTGLARLHSAGIAHCDIKPENIVLSQKPAKHPRTFVAKYIDFGFGCASAKECGKWSKPGTVAYHPPEYYGQHSAQYDRQTDALTQRKAHDVYSLGMTFEFLIRHGRLDRTKWRPLLSRMMRTKPAKRASAAQALAFFSAKYR